MENVFFKPWVGKDYFEQGYSGKKILVLGESHYCGEYSNCGKCGNLNIENDECRNFTTRVVKLFLNYKQGEEEFEGWMNTYTRFTNVFHGKQVDVETLLQFWDSIVFYNYVQYSTPGPGKSPQKNEFIDSKTAFFEVLKEYKPDVIIVWGFRLWERLPDNGTYAGFDISNDPNGECYYYEVDDKKILAYAVYHPSRPSFSDDYYEYLQEVLKR